MSRTLEIHRGDAEARSADELIDRVVGACVEIHRCLGPGSLESAYEECLCYGLAQAGIEFERQRPLPVSYKSVKLDCGYRLDFVVGGELIAELKSVEKILPIHEAQLLTYLKLSRLPLGLLNFNVPVLKQGLKRMVNKSPDFSASPRLRG